MAIADGSMTEGAAESKPAQISKSYWAEVWFQYRRYWLNRLALVVIAFIGLVAIFADFLASDKPIAVSLDGETYLMPNVFEEPELRIYDNQLLFEKMGPEDWAVFPPVPWGYNSHDLDSVLAPPSGDHLLGTDTSGRDVMSRVIHGSRVSLAVGVMAVVVLVVLGVFLGSIAGYFGGIVDGLLMRIVEIVHSIPTILLLVTLIAVINPVGWWAVGAMMLVIGLIRWTDVARLIRAEILRVKGLDYVEAMRALGATDARILARHVVPNAISPVLVTATFSMASAILIEGSLSFLGFGIPDDMASWGGLLNEVRGNSEAWWLAVFPGAAIFVTVTVYNLAGEGLRDATDPKLKS